MKRVEKFLKEEAYGWQQRQAQGQRRKTAQNSFFHRCPPLVFPARVLSPAGRVVSRRGFPYGPGGAPGHFYRFTNLVYQLSRALWGRLHETSFFRHEMSSGRPPLPVSIHLHPASFFAIKSYTVHRCTMQELFLNFGRNLTKPGEKQFFLNDTLFNLLRQG